MVNASNHDRPGSLHPRYDFIVVGAGAADSVLAADLSAAGAQVLVNVAGELPVR